MRWSTAAITLSLDVMDFSCDRFPGVAKTIAQRFIIVREPRPVNRLHRGTVGISITVQEEKSDGMMFRIPAPGGTLMKPAICIEMIYPELSFADRIRRVAHHGFRLIEFWSWKDKVANQLQAVLRESGVSVANYSAQRLGDLLREEQHPIVERDFRDALTSLQHYQSPTMMLLSQELGDGGRVVRPVDHEADGAQIRTIAAGVRRLLDDVPGSGPRQLVFEPLNTRLDHPGYAVSSLATARALVEAVDSPRFRILADLYHQAMSGDNLRTVVPEYASIIGYVHVADVPGRGEPGSGHLDWVGILNLLATSGYSGVVGFEFSPSADSDTALERTATLWRGLFGDAGF
jgi:hydroxypyruvate isomerase